MEEPSVASNTKQVTGFLSELISRKCYVKIERLSSFERKQSNLTISNTFGNITLSHSGHVPKKENAILKTKCAVTKSSKQTKCKKRPVCFQEAGALVRRSFKRNKDNFPHADIKNNSIYADRIVEELSSLPSVNQAATIGSFASTGQPAAAGEEEIMAAVKEVQQLISSDLVVIFSKTSCPYCRMAKEVFQKIGQKYTVVELNARSDGPAMQDALENITGGRTVPRVFINSKFVGGGSDVEKLHKDGKLEEILKQKGVTTDV